MKKTIRKTFVYIFLLLIVLCIMLPVFTMITTAFKSSNELYLGNSFFPKHPTIEKFLYVIKFQDGLFLRGLANSTLVGLVVIAVLIPVSALAGYALARFKGRIFRAYSSLLLVLYMLPISLALLPLFTVFKTINVLDTPTALFLAYMMMSVPFAVWMFKGFVASIPVELEEAAMIDGCSKFGAFCRVILPLTGPGIASISIYTFLSCWSEYLMSSVFVKDKTLQTATVMIQFFKQEQYADWGALMAAATMNCIPAILLLLFAQKYIVAGITAGSVKG